MKKGRIECQRCSGCCSGTMVPLTDSDVKRLVKATGKPASDIVRRCDSGQTDYERDRDGWISLSYGKRILGIRQRNKRCIFLDENDHCEAYLSRPMTCRTFPYQVEHYDDGTLEGITLNRAVKCKCPTGPAVSKKRLQQDGKKEDAEDEAYYKKLRRWNGNGHSGGKEEFLAFLGL